MKSLASVLALATVLVSTGAMAQAGNPTLPGHPRINQIDQRLENQQKRIESGVQDGQINAKQLCETKLAMPMFLKKWLPMKPSMAVTSRLRSNII